MFRMVYTLVTFYYYFITYFEAVQNVATPMSHWPKYIEDSTVCYFSRQTFGSRSMLFRKGKRK